VRTTNAPAGRCRWSVRRGKVTRRFLEDLPLDSSFAPNHAFRPSIPEMAWCGDSLCFLRESRVRPPAVRVAWQLESAETSCSDTTGARFRGWEAPYYRESAAQGRRILSPVQRQRDTVRAASRLDLARHRGAPQRASRPAGPAAKPGRSDCRSE
jgi:hypothetical protein